MGGEEEEEEVEGADGPLCREDTPDEEEAGVGGDFKVKGDISNGTDDEEEEDEEEEDEEEAADRGNGQSEEERRYDDGVRLTGRLHSTKMGKMYLGQE